MKIAISLLFVLSTTDTFSQKLSTQAIEDFAAAAQVAYLVNDNFYLTVNTYFRKLGKKEDDAQTALVNFKTDPDSRELIFKSIHSRIRANRGALSTYLSNDLQIKTTTVKELADYIYKYYSGIAKKPTALFTGTKTFQDKEKYWKYVVTITGSKIVLKSYPGNENTTYPNKNKVSKTYTGIIEDGKIMIDKNASQFRYENGKLYEMNNEGGWNEYLAE